MYNELNSMVVATPAGYLRPFDAAEFLSKVKREEVPYRPNPDGEVRLCISSYPGNKRDIILNQSTNVRRTFRDELATNPFIAERDLTKAETFQELLCVAAEHSLYENGKPEWYVFRDGFFHVFGAEEFVLFYSIDHLTDTVYQRVVAVAPKKIVKARYRARIAEKRSKV